MPFEAHVRERALHQLPDGVTDSSGNDVVVSLVLLQHQPHRPHIVACKAPVATCIQVAKPDVVGQSKLDAGYTVRDLSSDELKAAARRLVIEENARYREDAVALA